MFLHIITQFSLQMYLGYKQAIINNRFLANIRSLEECSEDNASLKGISRKHYEIRLNNYNFNKHILMLTVF